MNRQQWLEDSQLVVLVGVQYYKNSLLAKFKYINLAGPWFNTKKRLHVPTWFLTIILSSSAVVAQLFKNVPLNEVQIKRSRKP
jgi:hypothetical protein